MCVPCVLQVSRAFTFKQQCRRSDETLRTFLESISCDIPKETDNNNVDEIYTNIETDIDRPSNENIITEEAIPANETEFTATNQIQPTNDNLDSGLVLDSLPPEMESDAFEEEIELSSLPSESQFSVAEDDLHTHLVENVLSDGLDETKLHKDYFAQIKLDASNVVSLTDTGLSGQSIDETFGMCWKCIKILKKNDLSSKLTNINELSNFR